VNLVTKSWTRRHPWWAILGCALLGAGLGCSVLTLFVRRCPEVVQPPEVHQIPRIASRALPSASICNLVHNNPPWALLGGIVAVPGVLLTWYFRTKQKEVDIDAAQAAGWAARFDTGVNLVEKLMPAGVFMLEGVVRENPAAYGWPVTATLVSKTKEVSAMNQVKPPNYKIFVAAALRTVGSRDARADLCQLDLTGCDFSFINLSDLKLVNTDFSGSAFQDSDLRGVNFTDSMLGGISALGARFDDTTILSDVQLFQLLAGNADDHREVPARPGHPPKDALTPAHKGTEA